MANRHVDMPRSHRRPGIPTGCCAADRTDDRSKTARTSACSHRVCCDSNTRAGQLPCRQKSQAAYRLATSKGQRRSMAAHDTARLTVTWLKVHWRADALGLRGAGDDLVYPNRVTEGKPHHCSAVIQSRQPASSSRLENRECFGCSIDVRLRQIRPHRSPAKLAHSSRQTYPVEQLLLACVL